VARRAWLRWALLVVLVVAVFAPALRGEFLQWDDQDHVLENTRVTASDGLLQSWVRTESPGFYPITYTTFWLEWRLSGGKPWLFHLDNILLHAANAVMVGLLAAELGFAAGPAWFVALLWAVHPLQVASVGWIAERKNVLYVFLYLLALHLHLAAERQPPLSRAQPVRWVGAVVLFGYALLSKAAAMTLPAAIVLVQWARRRPLDGAFWRSLVPYGAVAFGAGLALLSSVPPAMRKPDLAARLEFVPRALATYVGMFVWPRGLLPLYPRWPLRPPGAAVYAAWAGLGALALALVALRGGCHAPFRPGSRSSS
jgi:hypothetical protein